MSLSPLFSLLSGLLLAILALPASAAPGLPSAGYDDALCVTAQRLLVNDPDMRVRVQRGQGQGFHNIQMSVDADHDGLVVAMSTVDVEVNGGTSSAYVACKMVNRERTNDQLGRQLDGPRRTCRDVNEHTFQVAFAGLSDEERNRYVRQGRTLLFSDDTIVATGGEWLPAVAEDYMEPGADGRSLQVSAPSVQVPWDATVREFFQGTHHCKLITLATMERWLRQTAFEQDASLYPFEKDVCLAPSSAEARAGSCLLYFAPVREMFCTDYSGRGWTEASARADCAKRHESPEALAAAENRYEGAGGIFSTQGCATREDTPPISGTCVFHCNKDEEVLWQNIAATDQIMGGACDLYLEP
ncbi:MAG: hypothetical protein ACR2QB_02615 [Gammaproteobacteria bacterium]